MLRWHHFLSVDAHVDITYTCFRIKFWEPCITLTAKTPNRTLEVL